MIELETEGRVPGIEDSTFQQIAETAKNTCPMSQALSSVRTTLNARLSEKMAA